jgi:hypothetical protein
VAQGLNYYYLPIFGVSGVRPCYLATCPRDNSMARCKNEEAVVYYVRWKHRPFGADNCWRVSVSAVAQEGGPERYSMSFRKL